MKNVLIVGELNQTVSSINKQLSSKFHTQICKGDTDMIKEMMGVLDVDLIVVSLVGTDHFDEKVLELLQTKYTATPVLMIGTAEECRHFQQKYNTEQFDYAVRPTTVSQIMQKCFKLLKINEEVDVTSTEKNDGLKTILAVDDSGMLLRNVKAMLENDYNVIVATSGEMAIKQAKKKNPDLILLDYEMPGWDGRRTLEEIQRDEDLKDIKVVFLTAVSNREHIEAVLRLKPSGYLLKPIDQPLLLDTIEKVLSGEL